MSRRAWPLLVAALLWPALLWPALPAAGQSTRYPPAPVDYDEDSEQHSKLWEQVLSPHQDRYQARVRRAVERARQGDEQALDEAEALLGEASALVPDQPLAHWIVATLQERRERWQACVASYTRVFELEPGYRPASGVTPAGRRPAWALDFGLGTCHAHAGAFERAITHYQRILSRGVTDQALVYQRLGEAYMALGRLGEAIDMLAQAQRQQPGSWRTSYALAVAYDRDEKEALSRAALMQALRYDQNLSRLKAPEVTFLPATDELYYLGLAHAGRGAVEWSMAYFRHYVHVAGEGPWARRAREHLRDLARDASAVARRVHVTGPETVDREQVAAVVARGMDAMHDCVAATPGLLLEVRVTALGRSGRALPGRAERAAILRGAEAGVKAHIVHSFATEPAQADQAQACVEAVAQGLAIPQPASAERYVSVRFLVIAPESAARGTPGS